MNIHMLSEAEPITIFQDVDTGNTYIVEQMLGADEPMELADEDDLFYGYYGDYQESDNHVFKIIGDYVSAHDEYPTNMEEYAKLFKGELCSHFKCDDGWEDYDFMEQHGGLFAVNKRLGTAEEWLNYCDMNDNGDVYSVLDCSTGTKVTDIYAEYQEDALELYLKDGELASLKAQVNKVLED